MEAKAKILAGRILLALPLATVMLVAADEPPGFGTCSPRSQKGERQVGCFIITEEKLGALGEAPVFWHVTELESRAAADAPRSGRDTVIEAYGKAWLMTIGPREWTPRSGRLVKTIGPLPVKPGVGYSALYMEASMTPGMKSRIHRHSGVEAWYTLSGETCLETPDGASVGRADDAPVIVPEGLPMELTATGTALRTSLVLILHRSAKPATTLVDEWHPRGLCKL